MEVTVAATNKTPVSSVRGAGYPQAAFAMERLMDRVARELDSIAPRCAGATSSRPKRCPTPSRSRRAPAPACNTTAATIRPARRRCSRPRAGTISRSAKRRRAREGRYIGIGLAHGIKGTGRGPFESGVVRVSNTGRVSVFTGAAAIGQGLRTALAQICAGELGMRARGHHGCPRRHRRRRRLGLAPSPAGRP